MGVTQSERVWKESDKEKEIEKKIIKTTVPLIFKIWGR